MVSNPTESMNIRKQGSAFNFSCLIPLILTLEMVVWGGLGGGGGAQGCWRLGVEMQSKP